MCPNGKSIAGNRELVLIIYLLFYSSNRKEAREILEQYPVLLSEEVTSLLDAVVSKENPPKGVMRIINDYRFFLIRYRDLGIDKALDAIFKPSTVGLEVPKLAVMHPLTLAYIEAVGAFENAWTGEADDLATIKLVRGAIQELKCAYCDGVLSQVKNKIQIDGESGAGVWADTYACPECGWWCYRDGGDSEKLNMYLAGILRGFPSDPSENSFSDIAIQFKASIAGLDLGDREELPNVFEDKLRGICSSPIRFLGKATEEASDTSAFLFLLDSDRYAVVLLRSSQAGDYGASIHEIHAFLGGALGRDMKQGSIILTTDYFNVASSGAFIKAGPPFETFSFQFPDCRTVLESLDAVWKEAYPPWKAGLGLGRRLSLPIWEF